MRLALNSPPQKWHFCAFSCCFSPSSSHLRRLFSISCFAMSFVSIKILLSFANLINFSISNLTLKDNIFFASSFSILISFVFSWVESIFWWKFCLFIIVFMSFCMCLMVYEDCDISKIVRICLALSLRRSFAISFWIVISCWSWLHWFCKFSICKFRLFSLSFKVSISSKILLLFSPITMLENDFMLPSFLPLIKNLKLSLMKSLL